MYDRGHVKTRKPFTVPSLLSSYSPMQGRQALEDMRVLTSSGCAPEPLAMRTMRDSDFSMSTFPSSSSSVMESIMYSMRLTRFVCCVVGWHRAMRGPCRKEADKQPTHKNTRGLSISHPPPRPPRRRPPPPSSARCRGACPSPSTWARASSPVQRRIGKYTDVGPISRSVDQSTE